MVTQARPSDTTLAAHDRLYRTLRQQIMHGELAPGQALTIRGLGKTYGLSMTPVREALRRLAAEADFRELAIFRGWLSYTMNLGK